MFARLGVNEAYSDTSSESELTPSHELDPSMRERIPSILFPSLTFFRTYTPAS